VPANRGRSVAESLKTNSGLGPGFDALRLILSVWVLVVHGIFICEGVEFASQFVVGRINRILVTPVVPAFFIVSGYLITGSAFRVRRTLIFLLFRVLRIAPALIVEVVLSALVLGPLLTDKLIGDYFSDPLFFRYFLNIVGSPQLFLPGMFAHNPVPGVVNMNLWTLKPEFYCYLFITALMASRLMFCKSCFTAFALAILCITAFYTLSGSRVLSNLGVVDWKFLIVSFTLGCLAFHWNDRLVVTDRGAVIAVSIAVGACMFPRLILLGLLALTYLTVYVGMSNVMLPTFLKSGDYSYGIYLFGAPIQQTLVYFLLPDHARPLIVLAFSLPITFAFAVISWRFVERPAQGLKRLFDRPVRQAFTPSSLGH
jgi:peptidoglycan/LPS O-acetylase OafA/YrhL